MLSSFPTPPNNVELSSDYLRRLVNIVNGIMRGKTNNTAEVTLIEDEASTTVENVLAGAESTILFMPLTADAAAEVAAGGMYVSAQDKGTFTITHANDPSTDRRFRYAIIG